MKLKYQYYNSNPHANNCEDCMIRAISKCENISWEEAFSGLAETAMRIKNTMSHKQTMLVYFKDRYIIKSEDCEFKSYKPFEKKALLLLSNNHGQHLIYVENQTYFDKDNIDNLGYRVVECYIPKEAI